MKIPQSRKNSKRSSLESWADKQAAGSPMFFSAPRYLVRLILITLREFGANVLSLRSAALTYTVLLSIVPILAMSTAVVKGLGGGDQLRKAAYSYIATLEENSAQPAPEAAPGAPQVEQPPDQDATLTGHLRSGLDKLFAYVDKTNFATLGTIGMVGILLTVVQVLSYIEEAMNAIWKVTAGRSILRKIADYLTLLVLMPISINVAFAASAFLKNPALASRIKILIPFVWLQTLLLKAVPVAVIALTFYVMYIFFPNTKVKTLPAVIGAALAAVCWFAVQNLYITLQVGVANYNAIYGSFATLPLFLAWVYLGWMFILAGAQLAFALQNIKTYRLVQETSAPSLRLAVAFDIMDAVYRAFADGRSQTADALTDSLPQYARTTVYDVISVLKDEEMLHVSRTDERLLPSVPADRYHGRAVIDALLGTETGDSDGGLQSRRALQAAGDASGMSIRPVETEMPEPDSLPETAVAVAKKDDAAIPHEEPPPPQHSDERNL